jgi:acyl-CoA thioesterase-1
MQLEYQKFGRFYQMLRLLLCGALVLFATSAYSASKTVLVLGDSLSAEYGLPRGAGWVALLQNRLQAEKIDANIINASISGETTSGGTSRLPALLSQHHPDLVIIELGANDGLRGLPLAATEANLERMIKVSRKAGAKVLLIGMRLPPNYGSDYTTKFFSLFANLAKSNHIALVPFLLEGVATRPDLFQADRIHPTAAAHPLILNNVWPVLKPLVKK